MLIKSQSFDDLRSVFDIFKTIQTDMRDQFDDEKKKKDLTS